MPRMQQLIAAIAVSDAQVVANDAATAVSDAQIVAGDKVNDVDAQDAATNAATVVSDALAAQVQPTRQ